MTVAPGEVSSPSSVGTGGVAFDGLAAGVTDVDVTISGFLSVVSIPQTVTVTAPEVIMYSFPFDLGSGLQTWIDTVPS